MTEAQRTILVGVDYSDQSVHAVDEALRAAAAYGRARLVPVLVLPASTISGAPDVAEMTRELVDRSNDNLKSLTLARAKLLGVIPASVEPRVRFGKPADELLALSRELGVELIAVGTHGRRGLSHLLLGSVAEEVTRNATCSVLVARSPQADAAASPEAAAARSGAGVPTAAAAAAASGPPADVEDAEPTIVSGPHIDAGRVVLHVLDPLSRQVFVCAFEDDDGVSVEPIERSWVPAPSSSARARAARIALDARDRDRARFAELFAEARRRAHEIPE